jgi:hypothetical protein
MRELFTRLCDAVRERDLGWTPRRDGESLVFTSRSENPVAIHVSRAAPPSFLIRLPAPLAELDEANPYPGLPMFWIARFRAQGWNVEREDDVPDLSVAVEIAEKYEGAQSRSAKPRGAPSTSRGRPNESSISAGVPRRSMLTSRPSIYLTTFRPLLRTAAGRAAIDRFGLPPFIDDSCRREPDFQSAFPSITALCRGRLFAPKLRVGDIVVYMTKKLGSERWLVAILEVSHRFETHGDAARWYESRNLPLPSNCMVPTNPPVSIEKTSGAEELDEWNAGYQWRADTWGTFLATRPLHLELHDPPALADEVLRDVFGRVPGTQNPSRIAAGQLERLRDALAV